MSTSWDNKVNNGVAGDPKVPPMSNIITLFIGPDLSEDEADVVPLSPSDHQKGVAIAAPEPTLPTTPSFHPNPECILAPTTATDGVPLSTHPPHRPDSAPDKAPSSPSPSGTSASGSKTRRSPPHPQTSHGSFLQADSKSSFQLSPSLSGPYEPSSEGHSTSLSSSLATSSHRSTHSSKNPSISSGGQPQGGGSTDRAPFKCTAGGGGLDYRGGGRANGIITTTTTSDDDDNDDDGSTVSATSTQVDSDVPNEDVRRSTSSSRPLVPPPTGGSASLLPAQKPVSGTPPMAEPSPSTMNTGCVFLPANPPPHGRGLGYHGVMRVEGFFRALVTAYNENGEKEVLAGRLRDKMTEAAYEADK